MESNYQCRLGLWCSIMTNKLQNSRSSMISKYLGHFDVLNKLLYKFWIALWRLKEVGGWKGTENNLLIEHQKHILWKLIKSVGIRKGRLVFLNISLILTVLYFIGKLHKLQVFKVLMKYTRSKLNIAPNF